MRVPRARLSETLFPDSPQRDSGLSAWEKGLVVVAFIALGTVLALARPGLGTSLNTVWAEDGPIYLQAALTQNFWDAVGSAYAGYLVLVPRLIAEVAAAVPLQHTAAAVSVVSALVAALCGFAVWCATAGHLRNPYLRGTLAALTVLAPAAGLETLTSAAYVPWYMLFACFWLLLWRPATLHGAILAGVFISLTALSTPVVWLFAPIAALRLFCWRDRRDSVILGSYGVASAIQGLVVLGQEQGEPLWTADIWQAYVQRVVDGGILGETLGGDLWVHFGWSFLGLFGALLAIGLIVGFWQATPSARWCAALMLAGSLLMFVASAYQRSVGSNLIWSAGESGGTASRYVLVPSLLLVSACLVLIDGWLRRRQPRPLLRQGVVVATIALLVLVTVVSFDMGEEVREKPEWEASLERAAQVCLTTGDESLAGIATTPEPWGVQIPCPEVASFAPGLSEASGGRASGAP